MPGPCRLFHRILLLAAGLAPLLLGQVCVQIPPGGGIPETCVIPLNEAALAAEVLDLVNAERADRGLEPVMVNDLLTTMAQNYSCEMIEYGFFDHVNPFEGPDSPEEQLRLRAEAVGYTNWYSVGENLAEGQRSPARAMEDWMNSPAHRDNILDPRWCEIGIGVRQAGEGGRYYWVQEFGQPIWCN